MKRYAVILLILYIEVNCQYPNITDVHKFEGQSYTINCGEPDNTYEKYRLKLNSITIRREEHFFNYRLHRLELIDSGVYVCEFSKSEKFIQVYINLIVHEVPSFKSKTMVENISWSKNSLARYDCELNSSLTFVYKWHSSNRELIKIGPKLVFYVKNYQHGSRYFCTVYLKQEELFVKPIQLLVRTTIKTPIMEYICSIPNGLTFKWFHPPGMYIVLSSTLACQAGVGNNKTTLTKIIKGDKTLHSIANFKNGDLIKCTLYSENNHEKSPILKFEHLVQKVKYKIEIDSLDDNLLNGAIYSITANTNTSLDENVTSAVRLEDIKLFLESDQYISYHYVAHNLSIKTNFSKNKDKIVITLRESYSTNEIVGTLVVFLKQSNPLPEPFEISIMKITDHKIKLRFIPYLNFMNDYCMVNVSFMEYVDKKNIKTSYSKNYITLKEEDTKYFNLEIRELLPNKFYMIRFQYTYSNYKYYSDFSYVIPFITEPNYLPDPIVRAIFSHIYIQIEYNFPILLPHKVLYGVIRIKSIDDNYRIFFNTHGITKLRRKAFSNLNIIATATIQYFSNRSKSTEILLSNWEIQELNIKKPSDLFGSFGFIIFNIYILFWFIKKIYKKILSIFKWSNSIPQDSEKQNSNPEILPEPRIYKI